MKNTCCLSRTQHSMCYCRLILIPLQLILNPDKSLWFHIVSLYCTDGDFADGGQIRLFPFSYQVFIFETCSCCECAVGAGHDCRAELSSPAVQQGKAGNKVIIEVIEEKNLKVEIRAPACSVSQPQTGPMEPHC